MLRSRGSTRHPQTQPRSQWSWERFCREEARESASAFLERVRTFKSRHATARSVHDSTFTNEFSAAFLEESSILMASGGNGELLSALATNENTLTTSLPAGSHVGRDSPNRKDNNRTGGKSWWNGLLEWSKTKRTREMPSSSGSVSSTNSSRLNAGMYSRQRKRNVKVLKETASVQLLDLNEQEDKDVMSWSQCKLVLVEQQDHYQIEIYNPPKSQMPKMSLFCFLIEEVRSTSRLEIPDSDSCFVVKSQNHRECLFDVRTIALKHEWVALIQTHSKKAPTTNGISRSAGLSSHQPTLPQAQQSPPVRSSHSSASQPNTPILTLQSSPLMVSRAHAAHNSSFRAVATRSTNSSRNRRENAWISREGATVGRRDPIERRASMPERKNSCTLAVLDKNCPTDSQESILVDMAPFMRHHPATTPPIRQYKAMSVLMDPSTQVTTPSENPYTHSTHPLNLQLVSHSHTTAGSEDSTKLGHPASVSCSSPGDSPPPLPKRDYKQRGFSVRSNRPINKTVPLPGSAIASKAGNTLLPDDLPPPLIMNDARASFGVKNSKGSCAKRKFSQPILEPLSSSSRLNIGSAPDLPSPGTLDTCSQSSSSSALHPISISALSAHGRVSLPTSPVGAINLELLSVHPTECAGGEGGGAWPDGTEKIQKCGEGRGAMPDGTGRRRKSCTAAEAQWAVAGVDGGHTYSKAGPNLTPAAGPGMRTIVAGLCPTLEESCSHIAEAEGKEEGPEGEGEATADSTKQEPLGIELEMTGRGDEGAVGGSGEKTVSEGGGGGDSAVDGGREESVGEGSECTLGGGSEAVGGAGEEALGGGINVCGGVCEGRDVETARTTPSLRLENSSTTLSLDERQKATMAGSRAVCAPISDVINKKTSLASRSSICGEFRRGVTPLHSLRRGAEDEGRGNHAILTFPYQTQQSNPAKFQIATGGTRDSSVEAMTELRSDSPLEASSFSSESSMRAVDPYSPPLTFSSSNPPGGRDGASSRNSNHTNCSIHSTSSSDARVESSSNNPIFVETTDSRGYSQVTMHTSHPYEYWATNQQDITNLRELSQFPWFHGMISRNNASQLVLVDQESGTGKYLVRQSESREGNFVLTFNYHNRAKHLRMAVDCEGCQVQHLTFASVLSMLDHFKSNSIPLESFWLNDDVKLTTYIDRCASDNFRTTTVVNVDMLNRVPPRRTRSLHFGMSHSVMSAAGTAAGAQGIVVEQRAERGSANSSSMNSLLQTRTTSAGWRQIFSQRSSSAGNVGRVQRSQSHNAGSVESTGWTAERGGQHGSNENAYVWKNY